MDTDRENTTAASARERLGHLVRAWVPTVLYSVLIMVLAFQPAPRLPRVQSIDKYIHATVYGILALLAFRSFSRSGMRRPAILAVLLAGLVGMTDECLQRMGTRRIADRYDLLADCVGAVLAMCLVQAGKHISLGKPGRPSGRCSR